MLLFWFVQLRINKIKKVEAERTENYTRLAESELKALRAQMNPHFMFNTLNAIQEIVLTGEDEKSRIYFADFAKMMRMILMNSTEKLITLEKEIAFIQLYLKFEKIRFQNKFQLKFDIDPNLETHSIRLPGMLLQPLIENAINHGLLHKIGEGLLHIRFFEKRINNINYLYCVIQDNGVGYKKSEELNQWKKTEHRSFSSSISEDRINILNSLYGKEKFRLKHTDLNEIENQTGTKVELIIAID
jgi:LytS/YehU family sensor histidine kinase